MAVALRSFDLLSTTISVTNIRVLIDFIPKFQISNEMKYIYWSTIVAYCEAKSEIAMIKVVAPNMAINVIDRAMQQQGARGLTPFTPLASFYVWARSLRVADGPDAVHLETIAKIELKSRL
ncbi:hypothetical protein CAEBREN_28265 [Caenorhabditis brenneri]|uniref:Acyl-CoA dehydrogenase/oxidase C-terminal domain-containing protein n=1 Tax=Caenorhabditis brenneri TaxID=135651 RepID=G0MXI3_CAEBE|nr:hypothetical protein CAEBREN_28265 [Caenorhabditis brenneri]